MMRKTFIFLLSAVLLFGAACRRIEEPGHGVVTLTFRVGEPATRAETPGDGNVADGGGIYCTKSGDVVTPDLVILIMDENGAVKKRYPDDGSLGVDDYGTVIESDYDSGHATTLSVAFKFTEVGSFSVYAVANLGSDGNLDNLSTLLSGVSSASALDNMQLGYSGTAPSVGSRMPLSATGTLQVAKGLYDKYNGLVELEMLRCVNKVQMTFKNLTGELLTLTDCTVTFKDMNTQKAWLFPRNPDFVELGDTSPADNKDDNYGNYATVSADMADLSNIPAVDNLATADVDERERDAFASPLLFFPSVAPKQTSPSTGNRYLCDISFKVNDVQKTFTNLPIHDEYTQDILALKRNQYLQIETTISKGVNVSFNFYVKDWTPHNPTVIFH